MCYVDYAGVVRDSLVKGGFCDTCSISISYYHSIHATLIKLGCLCFCVRGYK